MAAISFSSLHASASPRLFRPHVSRNTPGLTLYSRFTPSFSSPSLSFTLPHTARSRRPFLITSAVKTLTETELRPITEADSIPSDSGVYAVYDKNDELQFVGISRNIAASHTSNLYRSFVAPSRKKSDIRLTPGRHVELTVPLEELIDRLVKESKVVAFIKGSRSAPLCGFSQRVVGILESQGIDYETVDVLDDEFNHGLREKLKSYSNWPTFTQVFVKGELLGGCDILTSMYENGELGNMLK